MRPPRVRFTIRRMMVGVGILGMILGAFEAGQRIGALKEARMAEARRRDVLDQIQAEVERRIAISHPHLLTPDPFEPE